MQIFSQPTATLPATLLLPAPDGARMASDPSFPDLRLSEPLLRALRDEGYVKPTPIQQQSIPAVLEGRDLLGCARTGTGKTAAFVLPILQILARSGARAAPRSARALVVAPTRELAAQVQRSLATYGRHLKLTSAVVYGGVGQGPQVRALSRGVDVLVATPGRLLDLIEQKFARLDGVEILVLDEADQMLDLGFLPDVRRILRLIPARRQTLFFSATMPPAISALADTILSRPVRVIVTPPASTVEEVDQSVHFVEPRDKADLLAGILSGTEARRVLVFTRTKRGADRVVRELERRGVRAQAIHGNKSQGARERALEGFRRGRNPVLVATDIAARGLDVDDVTHVVNYELPNVPESYVHRIGRTARAGASGTAISLCSASERPWLRDIERLTRRPITVASGGQAPVRHPSARHEPARHEPARHSHARHAPGRHEPARHAPGRHAPARHAPPRHGRHGQHRPAGSAAPAAAHARRLPGHEFGAGTETRS
jgi:ATP-dependent RNA helicase RhlE